MSMTQIQNFNPGKYDELFPYIRKQAFNHSIFR